MLLDMLKGIGIWVGIVVAGSLVFFFVISPIVGKIFTKTKFNFEDYLDNCQSLGIRLLLGCFGGLILALVIGVAVNTVASYWEVTVFSDLESGKSIILFAVCSFLVAASFDDPETIWLEKRVKQLHEEVRSLKDELENLHDE